MVYVVPVQLFALLVTDAHVVVMQTNSSCPGYAILAVVIWILTRLPETNKELRETNN